MQVTQHYKRDECYLTELQISLNLYETYALILRNGPIRFLRIWSTRLSSDCIHPSFWVGVNQLRQSKVKLKQFNRFKAEFLFAVIHLVENNVGSRNSTDNHIFK